MRSALAIAFIVSVFGCAPAMGESGFPKQLQGIWTDTPFTCTTLKAGKKPSAAAGASWVHIGRMNVTGTTRARFMAKKGTGYAEARDLGNPNLIVNYTLKPHGFLQERIFDAQAVMLYLPCR